MRLFIFIFLFCFPQISFAELFQIKGHVLFYSMEYTYGKQPIKLGHDDQLLKVLKENKNINCGLKLLGNTLLIMLVITIVMIITKENNDDSKWLARENIETTDDVKFITEMETKLNESTQVIAEKEEATKLVESKLRIAEDKMTRKDTLNSLMAPLGKEKKELMSDLLESVKTDKLEESFNKYLPSVLDGEAPRVKKTLSESVVSEHTGDKAVVITADADDKADDIVEIDMIRKLAGLSK